MTFNQNEALSLSVFLGKWEKVMVHLLRWIIRMLYIVITHQMLFSLLMKDVGLLTICIQELASKTFQGLE